MFFYSSETLSSLPDFLTRDKMRPDRSPVPATPVQASQVQAWSTEKTLKSFRKVSSPKTNPRRNEESRNKKWIASI